MKSSRLASSRPATAAPQFFATLWSLRGYPNARQEWSWARKLATVARAGFDGVMSPPIPEMRQRGDLAYLAITSVRQREQIAPAIEAAKALSAVGLVVQLGEPETGLARTLALALALGREASKAKLSYSVETHRATWLETPEKCWDLADAFRRKTGQPLPFCFDFSHLAVVRHLAAPFWPKLSERPDLIAAAPVFHLRPFNAHHCQLPVTQGRDGRTPEYLEWHEFAVELSNFLRRSGSAPILVPELGHNSPAYRLSCFPDTWKDTLATFADLKKIWQKSAR